MRGRRAVKLAPRSAQALWLCAGTGEIYDLFTMFNCGINRTSQPANSANSGCFQTKMLGNARQSATFNFGHFYKPAARANFAPAVLAVHWVCVPCLPNPSARTSPTRDGVEKFPFCNSSIYRTGLTASVYSASRIFSSCRYMPEYSPGVVSGSTP